MGIATVKGDWFITRGYFNEESSSNIGLCQYVRVDKSQATGFEKLLVIIGGLARTVAACKHPELFAATPVASGTASLLLALDEHLTHERVRQIMIQTAADQVGPKEEDTPGRDDFFGYGRINLNDALTLSQSALVVAIDINPKSEFNRIRPASTRPVSVAVFGDTRLDVTRLSCSSLGFGPRQAEAIDCEIADVSDDGFGDLLASFQINATGIACGDTEATLVGTTLDGFSILGTDRVTTIGCRS